MPSSSVRMPITTSWKSLSPVTVDTSSKPICSSRPPGVTPDRTWTVPSGELKTGLEWKTGTAHEVAARRAVQGDRVVERDVGCNGRSRPHEREIVRQRAIEIEAVLDQEEGQPRALRWRAEIHDPCRVGDIQRVAEQDAHTADRAVGGDRVDAERVVERRHRRFELEREADRAIAEQKRLVGDAVDRRGVHAHAFREAGQEGHEGHDRMSVGTGATRHRHEVAPGEISRHLEARAADGDRGGSGTRGDVQGRASDQYALNVQRIVRAKAGNRIAVQICRRIVQGVGTRPEVERVVARAA